MVGNANNRGQTTVSVIARSTEMIVVLCSATQSKGFISSHFESFPSVIRCVVYPDASARRDNLTPSADVGQVYKIKGVGVIYFYTTYKSVKIKSLRPL